MKISVVEQISDGAVLLFRVVVRELWQKVSQVLSLRICEYFVPRVFTQHREKNIRLQNTGEDK